MRQPTKRSSRLSAWGSHTVEVVPEAFQFMLMSAKPNERDDTMNAVANQINYFEAS